MEEEEIESWPTDNAEQRGGSASCAFVDDNNIFI